MPADVIQSIRDIIADEMPKWCWFSDSFPEAISSSMLQFRLGCNDPQLPVDRRERGLRIDLTKNLVEQLAAITDNEDRKSALDVTRREISRGFKQAFSEPWFTEWRLTEDILPDADNGDCPRHMAKWAASLPRERRVHKRVSLCLPVVLQFPPRSKKSPARTVTRDIGLGGAYVERNGLAIQANSMVRLTLEETLGDFLVIDALVVRADVHGAGLTFAYYSNEVFDEMVALLEPDPRQGFAEQPASNVYYLGF